MQETQKIWVLSLGLEDSPGVFLPGKLDGQRSLVDYSPWGHKELDTIEHAYGRRQWHPTPVLLPGKSHGQRSLVGCSPSVGSLRVGHDWVTSLSLFTFMHWRRKWQPTPVFLPGESQGQGSLGGLPSMGSHRVRHDWSNLTAVGHL